MAPEVVKEKGYDQRVDVWSTSVIVYILLCEELPFYGAKTRDIYDSIVNKELDVSSGKWQSVSEEAKDFLRMGLNKNELERATCAEMLQHEWLLDDNSDPANSPLTFQSDYSRTENTIGASNTQQ